MNDQAKAKPSGRPGYGSKTTGHKRHHPHVGTPSTTSHTGNSTLGFALAAGFGKSPAISPVTGQ